MGANRSEVSKNDEYYISKERMLELVHFCRQYHEWTKEANAILDKGPTYIKERYGKTNNVSDPVSFAVIKREYYLRKKELVKKTCMEVCDGNGAEIFLLKNIISGASYDQMAATHVIPVCRHTFYRCYRKFFWLLDQRM